MPKAIVTVRDLKKFGLNIPESIPDEAWIPIKHIHSYYDESAEMKTIVDSDNVLTVTTNFGAYFAVPFKLNDQKYTIDGAKSDSKTHQAKAAIKELFNS